MSETRALDPTARWKTLAVLGVVGVVALGFALDQAGVFRGRSGATRPAPEAVWSSREGARVALADYRGKYVLLNYWATWCPPCVEEVPSLDRLAARLKTSRPDIVVIAPSVDQDGWPVIDPFLKRMRVSAFDVVLDERASAAKFGTHKLPETWLVGKNGEIINPKGAPAGVRNSRFVGAQAWDTPDLIAWFEGLPR